MKNIDDLNDVLYEIGMNIKPGESINKTVKIKRLDGAFVNFKIQAKAHESTQIRARTE